MESRVLETNQGIKGRLLAPLSSSEYRPLALDKEPKFAGESVGIGRRGGK
jgi:hypothetical protein